MSSEAEGSPQKGQGADKCVASPAPCSGCPDPSSSIQLKMAMELFNDGWSSRAVGRKLMEAYWLESQDPCPTCGAGVLTLEDKLECTECGWIGDPDELS